MNIKERFFQIGPSKKLVPAVTIWVDRYTGVQYLYIANYQQGGPTILLGADGKPLLYTPEQWQ